MIDKKPKENNIKYKDLANYHSNLYGLSDSENIDIEGFFDKSKAAFEKINKLKTIESTKDIIDVNNEISSYCALPLFNLFNEIDQEVFYEGIKNSIDIYLNESNKKESSLTKDLKETIINVLFFSPDKFLRKFFVNISEEHFNFLTTASNRPMLFVVVIARLCELYSISKNELYLEKSVSLFQILIDKIKEGNGLIKEVENFVDISLKDVKKLIADFVSRGNKKASLDQIKIILTRKFELGQVFHNLIMLSSSSFMLINSNFFNEEMFKIILQQMKINQILEVAIYTKNQIKEEKYSVIDNFIKNKYKIEEINYIPKIKSFFEKDKAFKYGVLIKQFQLLPVFTVKNKLIGFQSIFEKLNTVSNNITAFLSEKSLSITIALMSKNNIFSEFKEEIENKDLELKEGSQLQKIKDKDVMRKIKESDVASISINQMIAKNIISINLSFIDALKENKDLDDENLLNKAFEIYLKKYKIIHTRKMFNYFSQIFFSRIKVSD